jgi:hypothetical protein
MQSHIRYPLILAACTLALTSLATQAAVSAEEAQQLGTTLTPMGAEMAGNKDGSIPAWDLSKTVTKPLPGWKQKYPRSAQPYLDPYPGEKPLYSITADNMAQYADKLDPGAVFLLKNRPGYRMDVYPTHRSVPHPGWVYDNNKKCATTSKLVGGGLGFEGAHACVPFPIPKNGYEVMWNMITFYMPALHSLEADAYLVDSRGEKTFLSRVDMLAVERQYWEQDRKESRYLSREFVEYLAPAAKAGNRDLALRALHQEREEDQQFVYTQGLRRVRLAPELKYDTVVTAYGGMYLFDELNGFTGRMDRFDFKLLGKKEMLVMYNGVKSVRASIDELAGKQFAKPEMVRWELHRVWVVEGTLKPGMRHSQSKKVFYIDEDSWHYSAYNAYDQNGKLIKIDYANLIPDPILMMPVHQNVIYDLNRGVQAYGLIFEGAKAFSSAGPYPQNTFTPEALAGSGVR